MADNLFGGPENELTYKINWQGEGLRNISAHYMQLHCG